MPLEINRDQSVLKIKTRFPRLDGNNNILEMLLTRPELVLGINCIEIDMDSLQFINSMGLSELLAIYDMFCARSETPMFIRLLNVDRKVGAILELAEMTHIAEIIPKE